MLALLWTIVAVLVLAWLLGLFVWHLAALVWILLIVAVAVAIFNLFSGGLQRRT